MHLSFVVPGFSKCGTTTLCALLGEHPALFIPAIKEPNYFAGRFDRGWEWYEAQYRDAGDRACGDGSTFYSTAEFEAVARDRMLAQFPNLKFIFIARHPFRRLESSYREQHHSGHIWGVDAPFSIDEALRTFPNMVADTLYRQRIEAYRSAVPDSRIHVLFFEDFVRDPAGQLAAIFRFLGVDPDVPIPSLDRRLNPGRAKLQDTEAMRRIRQTPVIAPLLRSLPVVVVDRLATRLGLRKPVVSKVVWSGQGLKSMARQIADDSQRFLRLYGKPADFWDLTPPWNRSDAASRCAA